MKNQPSVNCNRHTALACLAEYARQHAIEETVVSLQQQAGHAGMELSLAQFTLLAAQIGIACQAEFMDAEQLFELKQAYPVLAILKNGNCVLVYQLDNKQTDQLQIFDPLGQTTTFTLSKQAFIQNWSGTVMLLKKKNAVDEESLVFNWLWFVKELSRYGSTLFYIITAALCFSLLELATPLYFQIVVDRVLINQIIATLWVVTIGIVLAIIFSSSFAFLRDYILAFISNKVELRLNIMAFTRLVKLPIHFFNQHQAGVLVKHMQQIGKMREFLLNQLFLSSLELIGLVIFIPILFTYSPALTLLVLGFTVAMMLVMLLLIVPFRKRLQELYLAEGRKQSLLVEAIHGIDTIKSLGIENYIQQKWNERAAQGVFKTFLVQKIVFSANAIFSFFERLLLIAIIFYGAYQVMQNRLSMGALIAFQMIATRVSQPLVKLVGLMHQWQETHVSIKMLSDIIDYPAEQRHGKYLAKMDVRGVIKFDKVNFTYPGQVRPALRELSLQIGAGHVLAIVGESGSGKSTFAKLLQGLYAPSQGRVILDGLDIRDMDLSYLRHNMGVVLQNSFLFAGTVAENIAIKNPAIGLPAIIEAAITAGADEFIRNLPDGYFTYLEEGAVNLSGGQRQRLAIARALITKPQILIFDEATSALDPDSEAIFRENLHKYAAGRSVVIITHRLSTIIDVEQILVLNQGHRVGLGTHSELLHRCAEYRKLWDRQYVAG